MPPLLPGPRFLGRPVNARVKAGLGGKEGAPLPLLLWKWQGYGWHLSSGCLGSLPPPVGLQEEEPETGLQERGQGGRDGSEDKEVGQGCAITVLPEGEQSANRRLSLLSSCPQAAAIEHLLIHFNIDPKEIPTFLFFSFFFLKCKKLSAALERGSLDRPFNAK